MNNLELKALGEAIKFGKDIFEFFKHSAKPLKDIPLFPGNSGNQRL